MSKRTDTSREVRLWIGTVITLVSTGVILASNPYVKCKVKSVINKHKNYFEAKKKEKEEKKEPHIEVVNSETVSQEPL